jgi:competence protein ComEC
LLSVRLLGRRRGLYLIPALAFLWAYILLTGVQPSALRAGLMGSAFLLALASGRAAVPINTLGITALALLIWEPRALWDRSFQLSFSAMAGVLFIGLPLAKAVANGVLVKASGERGPRGVGAGALRWLLASIAVSAGAVTGSLPLVALNFGQVPLLSIPATLVALPMVPVLLVSGVVTAGLGSVAGVLGTAAGIVPAAAGSLLIGTAELFAAVPGATMDTESVGPGWIWTAYAATGASIAIARGRRWQHDATTAIAALWHGPPGKLRAAAVVMGLGLIAASPWVVATQERPDGLLHVYFLDVGQGDATLLVSPEGATVLIDGGPDPRVTIPLLDALLPTPGSAVDLAVLTHPHADDLGGLIELARRGRQARSCYRPWWTPPNGPGMTSS